MGGRLAAALGGALLGAFLILSGARAQEASPPAPDLVALAQTMITDARAEGVFAAEQRASVIAVRHGASGLQCVFDPAEPRRRLAIFPTLARGEDVACDRFLGAAKLTLYATKRGEDFDLALDIAATRAAIEGANQNARAFRPRRALRGADGGAAAARTATLAFVLDAKEKQGFSRVSLAAFGPWVIKMRYTDPAASGSKGLNAAHDAAQALWEAALAARGPTPAAEVVAPPAP